MIKDFCLSVPFMIKSISYHNIITQDIDFQSTQRLVARKFSFGPMAIFLFGFHTSHRCVVWSIISLTFFVGTDVPPFKLWTI